MGNITTKLTVEIDTITYDRVTKGLHYGQLTQLIRAFAFSLEALIQDGKKDEIFTWLYNSNQITLPPPDKEK